MDIKEIALKLLAKEYPGMRKENQTFMVEFAESLIAELAKQNDPVAWWNGKETAFFEHETDGPVGEVKIPLYTIPPTTEQIANETAWQPIETAPKDGTVFLGYKLGQFRECYKVPRDDCDMWCFGGVSGADDLFPNIKPTHWMPLPTPPKRSMEGV